MFSISEMQRLMQPLPRDQFETLVERHKTERHCKGFRSWHQLLVMLSAQWNDCTGLRQAAEHFNAHKNTHYHLGVARREVKKSTLAEANAKRSPALFADVAMLLMSKIEGRAARKSRELLYLLDSTSITLKGREFERWTASNRTQHTQGVKLHVMLDTSRAAPVWHSITAANVNDVTEGVNAPIQKQATYVFDKGYCDYNWWHDINEREALFVTRFKRNAALVAVKDRAIPVKARGQILRDQQVQFKNSHPGGKRVNKYEKPLRRIEVAREDKPALVLATNDMKSSATDIAQMYQDRWQIELFFKWIKQHLNIKRFLGRTEGAVHTQILVALIAYLLLVLRKQASGTKQTLWELLREAGAALFIRRDTQNELYRRRREREEAFAALQPPLFT